MHIANTPNPIYNYFLGNGALLEHIVIIVIIPQMFNTFSKLDLEKAWIIFNTKSAFQREYFG